MKKNESIISKTITSINSWNWKRFFIIFLSVSAFSIYIGGLIYTIHESRGPDPRQVESISVGMTQQELFKVLEDKGWSEYDERGYHYSWNFKSPSGGKKTFWVTIKDSVITDIATY